jgi:hypothetical protein
MFAQSKTSFSLLGAASILLRRFFRELIEESARAGANVDVDQPSQSERTLRKA